MDDPLYLQNILTETPIVKIITANGKWREKIKLPYITPQDGEVFKIFFEMNSDLDVIVEFDEENVTLKTGMKCIFENFSGQWLVIEWIGNSKSIYFIHATQSIH